MGKNSKTATVTETTVNETTGNAMTEVAEAATLVVTPPAETAETATVTMKKRGRKSLPAGDKAKMQAARIVAAQAKEVLQLALQGEGMTNPEVWAGVPAVQFDLITSTMKEVKAFKANAKMAAARAEYEKACRDSGEATDSEFLATVPVVAEPKVHKYSDAEKATLDKARNASENELTRLLCDKTASDYRVWMNVPAAKLDAIANVTAGLTGAIAAKRVAEAKARIAEAKADMGL